MKHIVTLEEFLERLKAKHGDSIEYVSGFKNMNTKCMFKCKIDGHTWFAVPSDILRGHGCPECSKRKRIEKNSTPLDKMLERLKKVWGDLIEYVGGYDSMHKKCWWRCTFCNCIWKARPHDILKHHGCPDCGDRVRSTTLTSMIKQIKDIWGDSITYKSGYKNMKRKCKWQCNICSFEFEDTPNNLLNKQEVCPKCNMLQHLKEKHGNNIEYVSGFVNISTPCLWKCAVCGHMWVAEPDRIINAGHGCALCAIEYRASLLRMTEEEYAKRIDLGSNHTVSYISGLKGINSECLHRCNNCKHEWYAKAVNMLSAIYKCPICLKKSLEKVVMDALFKKRIIPLHDIPLEGSNYNGSSRPLRVDFIIETSEGKLAIETDGAQHFCSIYGEEALKAQIEKDRHKDKYLKEHGYILIRATSSPTKEWGFKNHITLDELLHLIEVGIDVNGNVNLDIFKLYDYNRE